MKTITLYLSCTIWFAPIVNNFSFGLQYVNITVYNVGFYINFSHLCKKRTWAGENMDCISMSFRKATALAWSFISNALIWKFGNYPINRWYYYVQWLNKITSLILIYISWISITPILRNVTSKANQRLLVVNRWNTPSYTN